MHYPFLFHLLFFLPLPHHNSILFSTPFPFPSILWPKSQKHENKKCFRIFTLQELTYATNSFNEKLMIGEEDFGNVYKVCTQAKIHKLLEFSFYKYATFWHFHNSISGTMDPTMYTKRHYWNKFWKENRREMCLGKKECINKGP